MKVNDKTLRDGISLCLDWEKKEYLCLPRTLPHQFNLKNSISYNRYCLSERLLIGILEVQLTDPVVQKTTFSQQIHILCSNIRTLLYMEPFVKES